MSENIFPESLCGFGPARGTVGILQGIDPVNKEPLVWFVRRPTFDANLRHNIIMA